ncbi:SLIRP, partial [Cervus elaphus hippelaphus]
MALRTNIGRPVAFVRKIPWTAASSELREHFAQFGHDKETGFHKGMGWIHFSSEEELHNALQQENHVIDGVKEAKACRHDVIPDVLSRGQLISGSDRHGCSDLLRYGFFQGYP